MIEKATPPNNAADTMDKPSEAKGWYVMPDEDAMDLHHNFSRGGAGRTIIFVADIDSPTPGFGEATFPNRCTDRRTGNARTRTAGGSGWGLDLVLKNPVMRHYSVSEDVRAMRLRKIPEDLLDPKSELGSYMTANAVVMSCADALYCALAKAYLTPDHTGVSPRDRFLGQLSPFQLEKVHSFRSPPANKAARATGGPGNFTEKDTQRKVRAAKVRLSMKHVQTHNPEVNKQSSKEGGKPPIKPTPVHVLTKLGLKPDFERREDYEKKGSTRQETKAKT